MKIVTKIEEINAARGRRALVPTMGALHQGHGELMRVARAVAGSDGEVVASIFVNPLQFEPGSDFQRYPRPEKADEEFCRQAGVNILFRPQLNEMYGHNHSVFIEELSLSQTLEGKSRPGHFRGVCTVVAKLFNIMQPDAAVFGEKDFQQLAVIRRMTRDLNYAIDIVAVPTVREPDGLACSSRNRYLNSAERAEAPVLRRALLEAKNSGNTAAGDVVEVAKRIIEQDSLGRIDYLKAVDSETLQPVERIRPKTLLAAAVYFGQTRLIDNIILS